MQVVSFETAQRLKEFGFPQPEMISLAGVKFWPEGASFYDDSLQISGCIIWAERHIFAPTATDVLPEDWLLMRDVEGWICQYRADFGVYVTHENPAEAAAAAWFWENDRK